MSRDGGPAPGLLPSPDSTLDAERRLSQLVVEFNVHRYTAPRGAFSSPDASVWKVVSGPLPSAALALRMSDNGFRAAIGRESDRRPLSEALEALRETMDLRFAVDRITPDASRAIEMEIGRASSSPLTVFYARADGRLEGKDFVDASMKFVVSFALRIENLGEVWVKIVPLVEEPPGAPKWVGEPGGGFRQVALPRQTLFEEAALTTPVPEGGFILLGATERVYGRPYLARPFFVEKAAGADVGRKVRGASAKEKEPVERESIYIISPIIRRVEAFP